MCQAVHKHPFTYGVVFRLYHTSCEGGFASPLAGDETKALGSYQA